MSEPKEYSFQQGNVVYIGAATQMSVQLGNLVLPYPILERVVSQRQEHLEASQKNNHLVAVSVLKTSVISFLQFERSFKSLFSKGDDGTQIAILKHAVTELRAANQSFDSILERSEPTRLFIVEPTYIVNVRELFEHCIKILLLVLQLLGQREVKTNVYEYYAQTFGWKGWQQVSEQVALSNNVLRLLVKHKSAEFEINKMSVKHDTDTHYRHIVGEIGLFTRAVSHMTSRFSACLYPTKADIVKIYESHNSEIASYITLNDNNNDSKEVKKSVSATWFI